MKKFSGRKRWVPAFLFCVALIAVFKTFDNITYIGKGIGSLLSAINPFFIAFVIAYVLNIPVKQIDALLKKIKNKKISDHSYGISILIIYLLGTFLLYLLLKAVVPALYDNIVDIYQNAPKYISDTLNWFSNLDIVKKLGIMKDSKSDITNALSSLISKIDITQISKYASGVFSFTTGLVDAFIAIIASIYMLLDKERILKGLKRFTNMIFKDKVAETIGGHVARVNDIFVNYIYCKIICCIIIGVMCGIAFAIMRVKYALILAVFVGIFDIIPYFGAIISVAGASLATLITGGVWQVVWVLIVLIILMQVDANLIVPKVMSHSLEISPLWVIFGVTVGGALFGFGGMILSVPVLAAIRVISSEYINIYEKKRAIQQGDLPPDEPSSTKENDIKDDKTE